MTESDKKAPVEEKRKKLRGKKKMLLESLKGQLGVVTTACKQAGVSRETHYKWLRTDENYKAWVMDLPELTHDFAENALLKLIGDGDPKAIIFYLKTKAKERGYVEKQEIEYMGGSATFNLIEKSVEEIKNAKDHDREERDNNKSEASGDSESS